MFKQIFRLTFATFIWKQYKRIIVSTLLLFAYLWLVGSIHSDVLSYAELQTDQSMAGRSFLLKWAALAGGVVFYLGYNYLRGTKSNKNDNSASAGANLEAGKESPAEQDDPFANIRKMKKLRTRSEISIDQHLNKQAKK
jgi:hypothetical protein